DGLAVCECVRLSGVRRRPDRSAADGPPDHAAGRIARRLGRRAHAAHEGQVRSRRTGFPTCPTRSDRTGLETCPTEDRMRLLLLVTILAVPAQAEDWKAVVEKPAGEIVKDRKYAAVVVGILDKDHEHVFSFGEWEGKAPDRDSVYEIGSVTKVFT